MLVEVAKRVAAVLLYMGIVAVVPFLLRSNAVVHHRQGGLIPHSTLLLFVATTTSAWSWPPNLRPPLPLGLRSSKSGSRSGGGGWVRQALHLRRRHPLGAWQQQPSSSRRFHTMAPNNKAAKQRAMAAAASSMDDDDNNEPSTIDPTPPLPALKRSSSRKSATRVVDDDPAAIQNDDVPEPKKKQQRVSRSKKDAVAVPAIAMVEEEKAIDDKNDTTAPKEKRTKAPGHQIFTERDPLPKLWTSDQAVANGSYTFKIASWNVAGLRAMIQKSPTVLKDLAAKHNLDVLCLQETKLQEQHLTDPKLNIVETIGMADDYDDFWACSTAKKGYSGTAVFVKKQNEGGTAGAQKPTKKKTQGTLDSFLSASPESKAKNNRPEPTTSLSEPPLPIDATLLVPTNVSFAMGMEKHDLEGRIVVVDYPLFTLCNVYVPNAGQKLERLSYRTEDWDKDFVQFMQQKQAERGLPVLWLGDLNIAHTNLEVWNDGAKHLAKQAGVTSEERASFGQQLETGGFVDAFRYLHSKAAGHYSYWSMRAGNRAPNKGLRLDYFVCDPILCQETSNVIIRDSYMDHEQGGSDHCPVILELEIKNIKLN